MAERLSSDDEFPDVSEVWKRQKRIAAQTKASPSRHSLQLLVRSPERRDGLGAPAPMPTVKLRKFRPVGCVDNPLTRPWGGGDGDGSGQRASNSPAKSGTNIRKLRTRNPEPVFQTI